MEKSDSHSTANTHTQNTSVRLQVANFGPIESGAVDLRPLTVFVGPSNTGKTYFAVLIYALHRILEGFSRLPGPRSPRESLFTMLSEKSMEIDTRIEEKEKLRLLIEKLKAEDRSLRLSDFPKQVRDATAAPLEHPEPLENDIHKEIIRCFDIDSASELARLSGDPDKTSISLFVTEEDQDLWRCQMNISESGVTTNGKVEDMLIPPMVETDLAEAYEMLLRLQEIIDSGSTHKQQHPVFPFPSPDGRLIYRIAETIRASVARGRRVDIHYLPAARSGIMQSHRVIASSLVTRSTRAGLERFPELPTFSGVIADFMQRLILFKDNQGLRQELASYYKMLRLFPFKERISDKHIMEILAAQLEDDTLAGRIQTKSPSPAGYPEFVYRPSISSQDIRLNRASSMVSELAPVVLFLRDGVHEGDTLIIEEPEAHLHPAAQTQMAMLLGRLVRAGVRVVVTTHSDWLLKEIGNLMREGELREQAGQHEGEELFPSWVRPHEVGIWLFHKGGTASGSTVEEIPFDRSEGIEPRDYEQVAEELYNRSADLQNRLEEATEDPRK